MKDFHGLSVEQVEQLKFKATAISSLVAGVLSATLITSLFKVWMGAVILGLLVLVGWYLTSRNLEAEENNRRAFRSASLFWFAAGNLLGGFSIAFVNGW